VTPTPRELSVHLEALEALKALKALEALKALKAPTAFCPT
jgi:hypothetical protein